MSKKKIVYFPHHFLYAHFMNSEHKFTWSKSDVKGHQVLYCLEQYLNKYDKLPYLPSWLVYDLHMSYSFYYLKKKSNFNYEYARGLFYRIAVFAPSLSRICV